jgi:hypothetical protein
MTTLFDHLDELAAEAELEARELELTGPPATPAEREASIQARFEAFHDAHPEVYDELVALARDAVRAGRSRIGVGMLWEVLRWNRTLRGVEDPSGFKLNDHYRSRYARLIMEREHDLAGIFEVRELRA